MSAYRSSPEWQAIHAELLSEKDETPAERMLRRIRLAGRLCQIEEAHP